MEFVLSLELSSVVKILLVPLLVTALGLYKFGQQAAANLILGSNLEFPAHQRKYFVPYFMVMFADWLQGPYVYKLYKYYGYAQDEIVILFTTGFGASVLFGTVTGPLADTFGRKKMAIAFCVSFLIYCLTKLSPSFEILLAGRILGGVSTSILHSAFESWYIHQHTVVWKYPVEWISITFSKATFFSGLLAIAAGVVAELGSEWLNFGPVAPFITAVPFLALAAFWISVTWEENVGQQDRNWRGQCLEGFYTIMQNRKILFLGLIQSIFESCMYIYVFIWTPVLDSAKPPLGLTFSSFMVAVMIGSSLYSQLLAKGFKSEKILNVCMMGMSMCMFVCAFLTGLNWPHAGIFIYLVFLLLEIAVGLYFPAIGYARGENIPDGLRANIMNWFRVPMNILTCGGLIGMHKLIAANINQYIFLVCGCSAFFGLIISFLFSRMDKRTDVSKEGVTST